MYPKLIISDKAFELIQECSRNDYILITGSLDEIVETLTSLKRATLDKVAVVGDINPLLMGKDVESRLLKLLESLLIKAVFISSGDGFSDIFISRFVEVKKEVVLLSTRSSSEIGFRAMMKECLKSEQRHEVEREILPEVVRDSSEFFPFYTSYIDSYIPKKNKMLEIWLRSSVHK
jgi:hypothetical protein